MKTTKNLARKLTPSSGLLGGLTQSLIDDPLRQSLDPAGLISKKDAPAEAAAAEVATMPTANNAAAVAARRRRMLANQMRSGRQSTMLSTTDTLG